MRPSKDRETGLSPVLAPAAAAAASALQARMRSAAQASATAGPDPSCRRRMPICAAGGQGGGGAGGRCRPGAARLAGRGRTGRTERTLRTERTCSSIASRPGPSASGCALVENGVPRRNISITDSICVGQIRAAAAQRRSRRARAGGGAEWGRRQRILLGGDYLSVRGSARLQQGYQEDRGQVAQLRHRMASGRRGRGVRGQRPGLRQGGRKRRQLGGAEACACAERPAGVRR